MSKLIKNILLSLAVFVGLSTSFTACSNQSNKNNSAVEESNTTKPEREAGNRKPQVNMGNNNNNTAEESVYKDGETITLAEGTKLKYSADGNHEIIEKGEGTVLIFKKITEEDLKKLEPSTRAMVERQMAADPNGFALIY